MSDMGTFRLSSPGDTHHLGVELGRAAPPGTVLALRGDLGAGKTLLAKGVGAGLGVVEPVTSPTFVLMALHEDGRLPFWHIDLYRLSDEEEAEAVGIPEALGGQGVSLVEWSDRLPDLLPQDHLELYLCFVPGEPEVRLLSWRAGGPMHRRLAELLLA